MSDSGRRDKRRGGASAAIASARNSSVWAALRATVRMRAIYYFRQSIGSLLLPGYVLRAPGALDCGGHSSSRPRRRVPGAAKHWGTVHFRHRLVGDEVSLTGRYFTPRKLGGELINREAVESGLSNVAISWRRRSPLPSFAVRATVRARRWFLDRYANEAARCGSIRQQASTIPLSSDENCKSRPLTAVNW